MNFWITRRARMKDFSQGTKLFFRKSGLFENLSKRPGRQCAWVHGHVGLSPVWVPQNFVTSGLPYFYKTGPKEFCQYLTGGVRHQGFRRGRFGILLRWAQARREPFSLQSTPQSIPSRQRALPQCPGHALSNRARGRVRSSSPEIRAHSQVREIRSSA